MNKKILLPLFLLNLLFFACGSDDSGNPTSETLKKVKSEVHSASRRVDYEYDGNGRVSQMEGIFNSFLYLAELTYDSQGNVLTWNHTETGTSSYSDHSTFTYDSNGRLSGYSSNTSNVTLAYSGNTVTATGTLQAQLELNASGKVIKLTQENQYANFGYDANGNLISAAYFETSGAALSAYTMVYDTKVNPFFGQLSSIYLEQFLEFFTEADGVTIGGFEGYTFPYQKNNVLSISREGESQTTFEHDYDGDNHPTNTTVLYPGEAPFEFSISYF